MINIKGYIYKITNLVNQKCYIGQTIKTVEARWKRHKADAKRKNRYSYNYPLYRAIRKYGINNFSIEMIEECDESILDEREIYWIKIYDSASKNGYNQTLGGGGTKHLDLNEQQVINTYKEVKTITKTSEIFNCSLAVITQILQKHNIEIKSSLEQIMEKGYDIIQYDENYNEIQRFKTKGEATNWLINNKLSNSLYDTTRMSIRAAILNNCKAYGYYWDSPSYSEEDKKIEQEKTKKKHAKQYKKYYAKNARMNRCAICNKPILNTSKLCQECTIINQRNEAKQQHKEQGITRELLKTKIRTQSFLSIGKEYGVSDNAIRKWCKLYNLPFKSLDIKKYSDEEWEMI